MSQPEQRADAAGFVLAGGLSSRMGADKALLNLAGEKLIVRVLDLLRDARLDAMIAGARQPVGEFGSVVKDDGRGPLSGVCAGLACTEASLSVFVTVDMPLLPAALITALVDHARITGAAVTLVSVSGFAQTFPAVIHKRALSGLQRELAADRRGCFAAMKATATELGETVAPVPVELLVQAGQVSHPAGLPAASWFLNLNSPEDLERAETLLCDLLRVS